MVAVNIRNRPHVVRAELEIPEDRAGAGGPAPSPGASGVLVAQGSGLGGWAFYMVEGRPAYVHNFVSLEEHHIQADTDVPPITPGQHEVAFVFTRTADHAGTGRLLVDGVVVGEGTIPRFTPMRFSISGAGLTCGYSDGVPVSRRYAAPFEFTGRILRVVIDVDGPPFADPEADAHFALTRQ